MYGTVASLMHRFVSARQCRSNVACVFGVYHFFVERSSICEDFAMQSRVDGVESCRFNLLDTGMATAKLALEVVSRERNREMMRIDDIL
jgi:hypothetical protein